MKWQADCRPRSTSLNQKVKSFGKSALAAVSGHQVTVAAPRDSTAVRRLPVGNRWYANILDIVPSSRRPCLMALTRNFRQTVVDRIDRDPQFAKALLDEAATLFLSGEPEGGGQP